MLFNSWVFVVFFAVVYGLYLLSMNRLRAQNAMLLVASYVFYGYWDYRFLFLILLSTVVDYYLGLKIEAQASERKRRSFMLASVITNLTILGFFKYFNFFKDSFEDLLRVAGIQPDFVTLHIILPVGISFYTFQTLSYTLDVYRGTLKPTRNFLDFALFVSFFPQLVAGPIERASELLPQVQRKRVLTTDGIYAGIFLVIWGLFKKVVVADNMALIANEVFNNYHAYHGIDLFLGVLAFAVQIYGDFSGYSDIARGLAKMMGFELMINFKLPYFAVSPSDFWRRWHISLSTWLRDYLYIPLGGNRNGNLQTYRNLMLTMLLGGLWHGAAWNFVIWGAYHGLILALYRLLGSRDEIYDLWQTPTRALHTLGQMAAMFMLTLIGWLIFRGHSVDQIGYFLTNVNLQTGDATLSFIKNIAFFSLPMLIIQLWQYISGDLLVVAKQHALLVIAVYTSLILGMLLFGVRESSEFIYFQF